MGMIKEMFQETWDELTDNRPGFPLTLAGTLLWIVLFFCGGWVFFDLLGEVWK